MLVDTAGYAARDKALLGQVTWLRATRNLRSLLVLPANLQRRTCPKRCVATAWRSPKPWC